MKEEKHSLRKCSRRRRASVATPPPSRSMLLSTPPIFPTVKDLPPSYLRADIARRSNELFALGWLGRAYLAAPAIIQFAFCRPSSSSNRMKMRTRRRPIVNIVDVTLRESSVVGRGIPFRLRLELDGEESSIRSAELRGIGPDVVAAANPPSTDTAAVSAATLSNLINTDPRAKRLVVRSIASTIFSRLGPAAKATRRGDALAACGPPVAFSPRRDLWAQEGRAEKWLQLVSGYYFAEATLQTVRYADSEDGTAFMFYYDETEPLNSDDPTANVNPEVIYCSFGGSDLK